MLIPRMHRQCGALLLLAAATSVPQSTTEAFTTPSTTSSRASATVSSSRTSLHGWMDAFANDDSLAPVQNAGISGKVCDYVLACSLSFYGVFPQSFFFVFFVSRCSSTLYFLSLFCSTTTPRRTRTLPTRNVMWYNILLFRDRWRSNVKLMEKSSRVSSRINGFGMWRQRPESKSIIPVNKVRAKHVGLKWTGNKSWHVNRKLLRKNVIFGCKQTKKRRHDRDTIHISQRIVFALPSSPTHPHTSQKRARTHIVNHNQYN